MTTNRSGTAETSYHASGTSCKGSAPMEVVEDDLHWQGLDGLGVKEAADLVKPAPEPTVSGVAPPL